MTRSRSFAARLLAPLGLGALVVPSMAVSCGDRQSSSRDVPYGSADDVGAGDGRAGGAHADGGRAGAGDAGVDATTPDSSSAGASASGSGGTIRIDWPPPDPAPCEDFPAPLRRPECPDDPETTGRCDLYGLQCLYPADRSDDLRCFDILTCSGRDWSKLSPDCSTRAGLAGNDERCPSLNPIDGEPCEVSGLICQYEPCLPGDYVAECECGRWDVPGCVVL